MKTKFYAFLTLLIVLIGINSCSKSNNDVPPGGNPGGTTPGTNEVWMQNTTFVPATKTITKGTTITWTNKDASAHDVNSGSGIFTSPSMGQNATFSYTFLNAGTFTYVCDFHPGMSGTIIVQ